MGGIDRNKDGARPAQRQIIIRKPSIARLMQLQGDCSTRNEWRTYIFSCYSKYWRI